MHSLICLYLMPRIPLYLWQNSLAHIKYYQAPNLQYFKMSNFFVVNSPQSFHDKDPSLSITHKPQKIRQAYISPFKQPKQQNSKDHTKFSNSPNRFIKCDSSQRNDTLPPRAVPFRRSRNSSRDKIEQTREQSREFRHSSRVGQSDSRSDSTCRITVLEMKLTQQAAEKQKWRSLCNSQQLTIKNLTADLAKVREDKQIAATEFLNTKANFLQSEKNLLKANENIQSLNKSLKEYRINQKSLATLKTLQNQLDQLQLKNTKLTEENDQLLKSNKRIKNQLHRKKDSTSDSEVDFTKKDEKIKSLELEVKRLREELQKDRSQRELILEASLHDLEAKLYEKESEIKKISIQLNCLDRKKYISIDEVKSKKDQEIKDLRQRFMKVSRDLKETKDKIEEKEKKRIPKHHSPIVRKIKSSKLLGMTSQSEQVTFELSSQF